MNSDESVELFEQTQLAGQVGQQAQQSAAAQYYLEEHQKSLAETQLEVESITTKCYHLLKQDILKPDDKGGMDWQPIKDDVKRVLTDDGVDKIMTHIHFYVNKNTLLSNFDEQQIDRLMLRFCIELNDLFLLKYEVLFAQATVEQCIEILKERNKEKAKIRAFAYLTSTGKVKDSKTIEEELIKETEVRIEYEIKEIRAEQRREKLREYGIIIAQLEMIVFAALNRAYRGEERGSIRRHTNISEILGGRPIMPKGNSGGYKWFGR